MEVEDVAGEGLPPGWPAQQQRQLAIGPGVAGEVIVDDQHVPSPPHEPFGHGGCGVGGDVLHARRLLAVGNDHDGMVERP